MVRASAGTARISKMPTDIERRALSVLEAARSTGLSRSSIFRAIANGQLKTLKVGSRRLIRPDAIEAFLEAAEAMRPLTSETTAPAAE
jgi:excisionase family DNA binding protein